MENRGRARITLLLLGLVPLSLVKPVSPADDSLEHFIVANKARLRDLRRRPPSEARREYIQATVDNIEWAEQCRRTGINSDFFDMLRYE
jgi:hypothetical protein